jgi:hypothetical protein
MGLLDRLFGRRPRPGYAGPYQERGYAAPQPAGDLSDEQAVARYRYLLRTAPPEQIEQAHAEAFAQLTTDQRQQVLASLAAAVPAAERPRTDDAETLARVATRAEMRQPGTLERALGGGYRSGGYQSGGYGPGGYGQGYAGYGRGYGGPGMGAMIGGSLLGTIGGLVIGTAVADALFDTGLGDGGLFGGGDEEAYAEGYEDAGGDYGGGDFGGGDFGGGDFGGGDF